MYASQLRTRDEILSIRAAERKYAKQVQLAHATLIVVREELATCYRENGVNHKMACKSLRDEYAKLIQDPTHGAGYPTRPQL
ncbi:unnamed protein product [Hyaloperonospora brassicae]|uniref:Uncharacterized protein n=1 Tax=Hyaloperonospora brassicae TaxID=162125 RepID=A0AAV0TUX9_HYABA|nr:unnamed protein product [Hyaloperonospora brassicae]